MSKITIIAYTERDILHSSLMSGQYFEPNTHFIFSDHIRALYWQKRVQRHQLSIAHHQVHCHNISHFLHGKPWLVHDDTLQQHAIDLYLQILHECCNRLSIMTTLSCLATYNLARRCISILCMSQALNLTPSSLLNLDNIDHVPTINESLATKQLIAKVMLNIENQSPTLLNKIKELYLDTIKLLPKDPPLCYICDKISQLWNVKIATTLGPPQQHISIAWRTSGDDRYHNLWMQNIKKFWKTCDFIDLTSTVSQPLERKIEFIQDSSTIEVIRFFAQRIEQDHGALEIQAKDTLNVIITSNAAQHKIATKLITATYYQHNYMIESPHSQIYLAILSVLIHEDMRSLLSLLQHSKFLHKDTECSWKLEQHIRATGIINLSQVREWLIITHANATLVRFLDTLLDDIRLIRDDHTYSTIVHTIQQVAQKYFSLIAYPPLIKLILLLPITAHNTSHNDISTIWTYVMQEFATSTQIMYPAKEIFDTRHHVIITNSLEYLGEAATFFLCTEDIPLQEDGLAIGQYDIMHKVPSIAHETSLYHLGQLSLMTNHSYLVVGNSALSNPLLQYIVSTTELACENISPNKQDIHVYKPRSPISISPPLEARPRRISVTSIGLLVQNPAIFCIKHILKLQTIGEFHGATKRNFGIIIHSIAEQVANNIANISSHDAMENFIRLIADQYDQCCNVLERPLLHGWIRAIYELYQSIIMQGGKIFAEVPGSIDIANINITCTADSIVITNEEAKIYDFKTGSHATVAEEMRGVNPQLLCEAVIFKHLGFHLPMQHTAPLTDVAYITFSNSDKIDLHYFSKTRNFAFDQAVEQIFTHLQELLVFYQQSSNAYLDLENYTKQEDVYLHLLRSRNML